MAVDFKDDETIDPMGRAVADAAWQKDVNPQVLLEHITEYVERQLGSVMKPGKARQNVIALMIDGEYKFSLPDHLRVVAAKNNKGRPVDDPQEAEQRIRNLQALHQSIEQDEPLENWEDEEIPEVDRAVMPGGITQLMIAAQSGEIEQVKELVENLGADPSVTCNSGMTAIDRARDFGYKDIAEYLSSRS